jgi:hypothetical protein
VSLNAQETVFKLERLFERFKLLLFLTNGGRSRVTGAASGIGIEGAASGKPGKPGSDIVKEGSLGGTMSMGGISARGSGKRPVNGSFN